jgi:uncharacterized membrane protein
VAQSINRRAIRWLRGELPSLVADGLLTAESADAIDRHYQVAGERTPNFGFIILAAIGSALVGAGIILLIAHNWDDLSRTIRCVIAFLPLLCALVLAGFVLLRRNESAAWREGVAIFDVAAVATAISLVSQTLQIQGNFADFLRVWLLLSIPIVYLFRTNFGALAYIIGCAVWALNESAWIFNRSGETFFWFLLVLIIPFYALVIRRHPAGWAFRALSVALVAAGAIGLGLTIEMTHTGLGAVGFAGFFASVYIFGIIRQADAGQSLNTLSLLGGLGIAGTAVVLSFEALWHLGAPATWSALSFEQGIGLVIILFFPAAAMALAAWGALRRPVSFSLTAACLPIVAIVARLIAGMASDKRDVDNPHAFSAAVLFNVYALILGIEFLVRGIRARSIGRANFGLLVIAALAFARFFDSDLSFAARGVGFIAVGAGFLIANVIFFRKRAHS